MRRLLVNLLIGVMILVSLPQQEIPIQAQDLEFREIQRLGDRGVAHSVEWSPDGTVVAISGSDGVWLYQDNFETEMQLQQAEIGEVTWYVKWSPDGRFLATYHWAVNRSDSVLRVWEVETWETYLEKPISAAPKGNIYWSPDSCRIAMSGVESISDEEDDYVINVWDMEQRERIQQYAIDLQTFRIIDLIWNENGTKLVSNIVGRTDSADVSQITIWDIEHVQPVNQYEYVYQDNATALRPLIEWSPDNRKLGVAIRGDVREENTYAGYKSLLGVFDAEDNSTLLWDWSIETDELFLSLIWNGNDLVSTSDVRVYHVEESNRLPDQYQLLTVWDANQGEVVSQRRFDGAGRSSITRNTDTLYGVISSNDYEMSSSTVEVVQIENGTIEGVFEDRLEGLGYFSDFHWALENHWLIGVSRQIRNSTGDNIYRIHVWDIETSEKINAFELPVSQTIISFNSFRLEESRHFSPDKETLIVAGATVSAWNVKTGELIRQVWEYMPPVTSISWSPDGSKIASVSPYETCVRIWDVASGTVVDTICHDNWVYAVAWSPDGSMIATGMRPLEFDQESDTLSPYIFVWDAATGEMVDSFANQIERASNPFVIVYTLAWHSDSQRLLVGSTPLSPDNFH